MEYIVVPFVLVMIAVIGYVGWQTYKLVKTDLNFDSMTVSYEDLFEEIPDDPDNVLMNIPPEVCKAANLKPGDTVTVVQQGNSLVIKKVSK